MKELLSVFKALSDETRLRIVKLLENGELCVCHIVAAVDMSQSKIFSFEDSRRRRDSSRTGGRGSGCITASMNQTCLNGYFFFPSLNGYKKKR